MAMKGSKARGIGDCVLPMAESKQGNAGGSPGASRLHVASRNALLPLVCTLLLLSVEEVRPLSACSPPPPLGFILLFSFPCTFFSPRQPALPPRRRQESRQTCLPKLALCLPGQEKANSRCAFSACPTCPRDAQPHLRAGSSPYTSNFSSCSINKLFNELCARLGRREERGVWRGDE